MYVQLKEVHALLFLGLFHSIVDERVEFFAGCCDSGCMDYYRLFFCADEKIEHWRLKLPRSCQMTFQALSIRHFHIYLLAQ